MASWLQGLAKSNDNIPVDKTRAEAQLAAAHLPTLIASALSQNGPLAFSHMDCACLLFVVRFAGPSCWC
jgi:hypothetical protein